MGKNNGEMPKLPTPSEQSEGEEQDVADENPSTKTLKDIKVVALRAGFFAPHRKNENDEFTVPSFKQLGSWMKCLDPKIEREHQAALKAKRTKVNKAAVE